MRRALSVMVICGCLLTSNGCSNFIETRTINSFADAIAKQNYELVKAASSAEFEQKALRNTKALDDFEILKLPTGEISVVKVEDVSEDKKKVVVEVGEAKRKLLYELVRNPQTKKWVVNDIYMTQRQQGITAKKSVTEQMDLLLTVRDFLDAWNNGERDDVLRISDPELAAALKDLHPTYLAKLTKEVVGEHSSQSKFKPEAQLNEDAAIVRLPRSTGQMIISLKLMDGVWKVQDVAVESRKDKDHINSVRKQAAILGSVCHFLEDYAARDQEHIVELCTPSFYKGCLIYGNWHEVNLPSVLDVARDGRVEIRGEHADFIATHGRDVIKISLLRDEASGVNNPTSYRIDEITLYEENGAQKKRLSALFTGQATVQLFAHSLAKRDFDMVRQSSTVDFNNRIWKRIAPEIAPYLPIEEISPETPKIMSTVFQGPITEITVTQGAQALTYVLKDENGRILVDDVIMPTDGERPNSFKTNFDFLITIRDFAMNIQRADLDRIRRGVSRDFNRVVWHQTESIPLVARQVVPDLLGPPRAIEILNDRAVVRLGSPESGISVMLALESRTWVIDDMVLIEGNDPGQSQAMKRQMRMELARTARRRGPIATPEAQQAVLPAEYEVPRQDSSTLE